jgi:hypothetical protein
MIAPLRFHVDRSGRPRARWAGSILIEFLETELAFNEAFCDRILHEAGESVSGRSDGWHTTGNAFSLDLDAYHATIRPLYPEGNDEEFSLPTSEFARHVLAWRTLLRKIDGNAGETALV